MGSNPSRCTIFFGVFFSILAGFDIIISVIGHKDAQVVDKKISKLRLFLIIAAIVVTLGSLGYLVLWPSIDRSIKEATYQKALENHEGGEMMSVRLKDVMALHYEKGNFDSIKPYIEETAAIYSDGYAKIEALSQVEVILTDAEDWSTLRQFYEYMLELAKNDKLDETTIDDFRILIRETKELERKK